MEDNISFDYIISKKANFQLCYPVNNDFQYPASTAVHISNESYEKLMGLQTKQASRNTVLYSTVQCLKTKTCM